MNLGTKTGFTLNHDDNEVEMLLYYGFRYNYCFQTHSNKIFNKSPLLVPPSLKDPNDPSVDDGSLRRKNFYDETLITRVWVRYDLRGDYSWRDICHRTLIYYSPSKSKAK